MLLKLTRKTVDLQFVAFNQLVYLCQVSQIEAKVVWVRLISVSLAPPEFAKVHPPKRGWVTLKQPVFGIEERDSAVYTELVTDYPAKTLQAIIGG